MSKDHGGAEAKPCPNCGHCPTCGHTPPRVNPWPYAYPYTYPTYVYPYWQSPTICDSAAAPSTFTITSSSVGVG